MSEINECCACYAVAVGLSKTDGLIYTNSMTLHTRLAATEDEAKGSAISEAMEMKPGFAVWQVLCIRVNSPQGSVPEELK